MKVFERSALLRRPIDSLFPVALALLVIMSFPKGVWASDARDTTDPSRPENARPRQGQPSPLGSSPATAMLMVSIPRFDAAAAKSLFRQALVDRELGSRSQGRAPQLAPTLPGAPRRRLLPAAVQGMASKDLWASHVTNAAGWRTSLSVYAVGSTGATSFQLIRWDDLGRALGEPVDVPIAKGAWSEVPGDLLAFVGSARVRSDRDLLIRVGYLHMNSPSLYEFYLDGNLRPEWVVPKPVANRFDWFGLALVNSNEARNSIILEAWRQGQRVAERAISLTGASRHFGMSGEIWAGMDSTAFDTVIVRSVLPIPAPVAVMGNQAQDHHLFFAAQPLPASENYRCLVNGILLDGTGREPVADGAVLFRDGVVIAAGSREQLSIPSQAELVDVDGAYILPGFVNAHVHNTIKLSMLQTWAREGVTTVRDVGARESAPAVFSFRESARSILECARLVAAGPLVTVPGGYPLVPNGFPSLSVTGPDDARQKMQQLIAQGADLVKIALERSMHQPTLNAAEIQAVVETAHAFHLPVTAHVTDAGLMQRAVSAGVDQFEHICYDYLPDALITQMIQQGVILVPTLTALGKDPRAMSNCRRFLAAGGKIAMGNDGGYMAGLEVGMPISELEALQEMGMTPMQVLQAATRTSAEACRLDAIIGTLEPGKQADILVVRGNPLEDWRRLRNGLQAVYHAGVAIR